ncbi:MAG: hypothetical protein WA985_11770 [Erythrobacter sp.]|uniref:hypothetical protein n=1 Tax=Erythrobacter sp. TaxID=1042 RepID=UPI003C74012C
MNASAPRTRRIGWLATLAGCLALFVALSFNVHAVKSEVLLAERQIISLERQMRILETEFQARASQRQLAEWNALELGYEAPRADQYLDGERELASLGLPAAPGAPSPIRIARAEPLDDTQREEVMRSPVSGEPVAIALNAGDPDAGAVFAAAFNDFVIDASPIRAARAGTGIMDSVSVEAGE